MWQDDMWENALDKAVNFMDDLLIWQQNAIGDIPPAVADVVKIPAARVNDDAFLDEIHALLNGDIEPAALDEALQGANPLSRVLDEGEDYRPPAKANKSAITDQQLQALSRKHLLIIIRDLEKDLRQAREENDRMLRAYKAGLKAGADGKY